MVYEENCMQLMLLGSYTKTCNLRLNWKYQYELIFSFLKNNFLVMCNERPRKKRHPSKNEHLQNPEEMVMSKYGAENVPAEPAGPCARKQIGY